MSYSISSAGLVYVCLNGYDDDGLLNVQVMDSYRCLETGFYREAMKNAADVDQEDAAVQVFAVLGAKEKTADVYHLCEKELKENFQRILKGKRIRKSLQTLDNMGNSFFRCIQEFFCEQPDHFPKRIFRDYGDFIFAGIFCSGLPETQGEIMAEEIVSLWLEREKPRLCGRQIMIHSFFLRGLIGRKVIACIPDMQTGVWSLVFEGGHQFFLGNDNPYGMETVPPKELGGFSSSNIQTILMNPIYAYGLWLQPNDLCEEWHKVFLYLCAVSEYSWDECSISKTYERFLNFLQNCICETMTAEPIISKEIYHKTLLHHIQEFRAFLQGEDEPVISKDLHQTMNCKYVYLPYLWSLVPHEETAIDFSPSALSDMVKKAMGIDDTYEKGAFWEDTIVYVLQTIPEWKITGRRIRAKSQEIDISVANFSLDDELWKLGAFVLVECKNWSSRVDLPQIRNIAHISNMKGNKTVILFSSKGVTQNAEKEIDRLLSEDLSIICITAADLLQIQKASDCRSLIMKKWEELHDTFDIASIL